MRSKLFVGNLNYDTTTEKLEGVFRAFPGFQHAKVCYDRHTGKPLGYAVVHFTNEASAQHAIAVLNNAEVDGRQIVVAPYRSKASEASGGSAALLRPVTGTSGSGAQGLVLNLHKNATWMDLKDMLAQYGKVLFVDEPRTVRMAVAHFASVEDREQVFAALRNRTVLGSQVDMAPLESDSILLGTTNTGPGPPFSPSGVHVEGFRYGGPPVFPPGLTPEYGAYQGMMPGALYGQAMGLGMGAPVQMAAAQPSPAYPHPAMLPPGVPQQPGGGPGVPDGRFAPGAFTQQALLRMQAPAAAAAAAELSQTQSSTERDIAGSSPRAEQAEMSPELQCLFERLAMSQLPPRSPGR